MSDATEFKRCGTCSSLIPIDAKKCTECGSFQDIRRFFSFSSTVLGLLVALISVLTFAIPLWEKTFRVERLEINAQMLDVDGIGRANFAVSNPGNVPVAIEAIWFASEEWAFEFELQGLPPVMRKVEPGDINILSADLRVEPEVGDIPGLVQMYRSIIKKKNACGMSVFVTSIEGVRKDFSVDFASQNEEEEVKERCGRKAHELLQRTYGQLLKSKVNEKLVCEAIAANPEDPENPAEPAPACAALIGNKAIGATD